MHDAVDLVDRVLMGGGVTGLETATLVDGDIDKGSTRLQVRQLRARDQLGRRGTGDQHRADDQVGLARQIDGVAGRGKGVLEAAAEDIVEIAQPRDRAVEHGDIGAHPGRDLGGMGADHATADHQHPGRRDAGHTAQQHAAPAIGLLQRPGADLRRQPPGHLGHRRQQRQAAHAVGDRLVGDAGGARGDEVAGLVGVRREVQVGKEDLALAQHLALDRLRFLDLDDHVGGGKDLGRGGKDGRAGRGVIGVGKAGAKAGAGLDHHVMAVVHRFARRIRGHADAKLLRLDLFRASDLHLGFLPWNMAAMMHRIR